MAESKLEAKIRAEFQDAFLIMEENRDEWRNKSASLESQLKTAQRERDEARRLAQKFADHTINDDPDTIHSLCMLRDEFEKAIAPPEEKP